MSVHPKKVFLGTVVEVRYEKSRNLPFFGPKWSKIISMAILKLVICNFFYGNPFLIQIEDSVKWGKIASPIRTLRIYSCFVKKIWIICIYLDLNLYRQSIKIELNVFLVADSSRLPLWKIVKYIQYLFFTFKYQNDKFAFWIGGLWL